MSGNAPRTADRRPATAAPSRARRSWRGAPTPDGPGGEPDFRRRGALLRRLLASGDLVAFYAAVCLATAATATTDLGTLFYAALFSPVWLMVLKLHGLYDNDHRRIRHSTFDELPALLAAGVLGTLALDGLLAMSPAGPLSAGSAIIVGVGAFVLTFSSRAVLRFFWHRATGPAAGIAIGPAVAAGIIARRLSTHPEARIQLVGRLSPAAQEDGERSGPPRLGGIEDLGRVAEEHEVERVVVIGQELTDAGAERLIEECKAARLGLTFLPQHFGLLGPGIELNRLAELPVLDFRFSDPSRSTMAIKRAMDIAVSAAALALLSPLLALAAILIVVDSGRPVFFRQRRAGKEGEPFTVLKFRTMVPDAEERLAELVDLEKLDEPAFKIPDDPRVTRLGKLLRRTSVDELPQLINVLRGDMSLVGPRPEEEAVVALYDERQRARLAVKPGLTGPMQVYGRGDLTFEERLAMERDYLDNISVAGDIALLLRTPRAIVRGEGAY